MHYVENQDEGLNDTMNQLYQRRLQEELQDWKHGALDYHTSIYERRAWYLLR
jgi:hypothetical protein